MSRREQIVERIDSAGPADAESIAQDIAGLNGHDPDGSVQAAFVRKAQGDGWGDEALEALDVAVWKLEAAEVQYTDPLALPLGDRHVIVLGEYMDIATLFLSLHYKHEDCWTLACWQGVFYRWRRSHWEEFSLEEVKKQIREWLSRDCCIEIQTKNGPILRTLTVGNVVISEVRCAIGSTCLKLPFISFRR
jgi:hypothetical protein